MPSQLQLSNGATLKDIGRRDKRGRTIYADDTGSLYSLDPSGKVNLSKSSSSFTPAQQKEVAGILTEAGLGTFVRFANKTAEEIAALSAPSSLFNVPSLSSYEDAAEQRVGSFFDRDMELLRKELAMERKIATENRDTSLTRNKEDETRFARIEDRSFARALGKAQGGFAGRGTFNSGFRNEAIEQQSTDREENRSQSFEAFLRDREDTTSKFDQFFQRSQIQEEKGILDINRRKNAAILSAEKTFQDEDVEGSQALATQFNFQKLAS